MRTSERYRAVQAWLGRNVRGSTGIAVSICVLGFALRLKFAAYDLSAPNLDENEVVEQAVAFMGGELSQSFVKYGPLTMYVLAGIYHVIALMRGRWSGHRQQATAGSVGPAVLPRSRVGSRRARLRRVSPGARWHAVRVLGCGSRRWPVWRAPCWVLRRSSTCAISSRANAPPWRCTPALSPLDPASSARSPRWGGRSTRP
jgi:hypothetical protein